jgi:hypothetical protein
MGNVVREAELLSHSHRQLKENVSVVLLYGNEFVKLT